MKSRILYLLLLLPFAGFGKDNPVDQKQFRAFEDSLKKIGPSMFRGTDQDKIAANKKFSDLLHKTLSIEGAFNYPFDSLKFIANLRSADGALRIFNWDLPKNDGTYMYYGFIMVDESKTGVPKKSGYRIYDLVDKSDEIKNVELAVLSPEKWYGALYYKIIQTSDKDKKYYTILGWDGNTKYTWKKIIDVITFAKDGKPIFGEKNLFQRGKRSSKRVVFEYRADLVMKLSYEEDKKRIVFDHLAPEVAGAEGMYQLYSQTFSYDSFEWKKGKWQIVEDIDARNKKSKKDDQYTAPTGDQNANPNGTATKQPPKKKKLRLFKRQPK
ncbi:MAG: hypothetical protein M3R17_03145 [Bacteroidota bacterium]|nr:hypothetical protein [Bacteroidota bacterium]